MVIDFNEKDHIYFINGEIATISVTELLAKHNLSPSYDGVDKELISKAAEEGKKVHADLEKIFSEKEYTLYVGKDSEDAMNCSIKLKL